jgi:hypothetical protein
MKEIDQLVRMANQIAANFSFHTDRVDRVADHLRRFWAPAMRKLLITEAPVRTMGSAFRTPLLRTALAPSGGDQGYVRLASLEFASKA